MKEFQIWREGYAATGEHSTADLIGISQGNIFDEACENFRYPEDILDWEGKVIIRKGDPLTLDTNRDGSYRRGPFRSARDMDPGVARTEAIKKGGNYCIWACQLFDNEAEARRAFG